MLIDASMPHLSLAFKLDVASQKERIDEHALITEGFKHFYLTNGERVFTTVCFNSDLVVYWLALVPLKRLQREKMLNGKLRLRRA